jgi:hypothetical protein
MPTVNLTDDAYAVLCGLVQQSSDVDIDAIMTSDEVWIELRAIFPLTFFHHTVQTRGTDFYNPADW